MNITQKILFFILVPMVLIGGPDPLEIQDTAHDKTTADKEAALKQKFDEEDRIIEEQRKAEDAARAKRRQAISRGETSVAESLQQGKGVRLDFDAFIREDAQRQRERQNEDKMRKKFWDKENKAATELRNEELFSKRTSGTLLSHDIETDKAIEKTRNRTIVEANRDRILQDFEIRAKRFNDFKKVHADFAKKAPWNTLLDLSDMNKFVNMSYPDRTTFLENISKAATDLTDETVDLNSKDIAALQDLIQLTRIHAPDSIKLSSSESTKLDEAVKKDLSGLDSKQLQDLEHNLRNFLKDSLTTQIQTLTNFSTAMEEIKGDTENLLNLRNMENAGHAAFWILGTCAGIAFLGHGAIAFKGVQVSMEQFAIGAKAGFVVAHVKAHSEAELSKEVQTHHLNIFRKLLPETMELIETISYENKAKSLTQRLKEKANSFTQKLKEKAGRFSDLVKEKTKGKIDLVASKNWVHEKATMIKKTIVENSTYKNTKEGIQKVAKITKEKAIAVVNHPVVVDAITAVKDVAHKAATSVKDNYKKVKEKLFGPENKDHIDYSEYSLATPTSKATPAAETETTVIPSQATTEKNINYSFSNS
ncbi:MAG TPA: hypothetical protein VLG50_00890 [Candidatus Saccharimonadales bacterium]|nr:hypothetical protein [Candidatus Saccharimonadales bacterium]